MKRRRISIRVTDSNSKTGGGGSSFSDLPTDILFNILLRLSIKNTLAFKCVCKTWYDLVSSDPQFAKLYFDQTPVYPLIRTTYSRYGSKFVHLMEPDKDDFDLKLRVCDHTRRCVCNIRVKINTKFEMPERYGLMKHRIAYGIVTCNGLLCLSNPSCRGLASAIICNPTTGEFINLPGVEKGPVNRCGTRYGFGFSPATNQYKVLRMSPSYSQAHVHILGTKTWKNIGFPVNSMPKLSPAYLNGVLYWSSHKQRIFSFDIKNECFGSILAPTMNQRCQYDNVGVLGGELCICGVLKTNDIRVWIMKGNSTERAWHVVFSYDCIYPFRKRYIGTFQPIKYLNDGALLMFNSLTNELVYMDPKKSRLRHLRVRQFEDVSGVEVMAYIPSIVSLKHALSEQKVKVHNIKPRSARLKMQEEDDIEIFEEREFHNC